MGTASETSRDLAAKTPPLAGGKTIEIQLTTDPWELIEVDAFVCPTNSQGVMSQYPTSKIQELSGLRLEPLIKPHTPMPVGAAFVTEAGRMRARYLIHVPNTTAPGGKVQVEDVLRATSAVLVVCQVKGFNSLAVPLMGAFESGIPAEEAARAIHSQIRAHRGDRPSRVLLAASTADEVDVFEMAIDSIA